MKCQQCHAYRCRLLAQRVQYKTDVPDEKKTRLTKKINDNSEASIQNYHHIKCNIIIQQFNSSMGNVHYFAHEEPSCWKMHLFFTSFFLFIIVLLIYHSDDIYMLGQS